MAAVLNMTTEQEQIDSLWQEIRQGQEQFDSLRQEIRQGQEHLRQEIRQGQEQFDSLRQEIRQGFAGVRTALADLADTDLRLELGLRRLDLRLDETNRRLDEQRVILIDHGRQLYNISVQIVELIRRLRVVERRTDPGSSDTWERPNGHHGPTGPDDIDRLDDRDGRNGHE